jgi:hypothetical protein
VGIFTVRIRSFPFFPFFSPFPFFPLFLGWVVFVSDGTGGSSRLDCFEGVGVNLIMRVGLCVGGGVGRCVGLYVGRCVGLYVGRCVGLCVGFIVAYAMAMPTDSNTSMYGSSFIFFIFYERIKKWQIRESMG